MSYGYRHLIIQLGKIQLLRIMDENILMEYLFNNNNQIYIIYQVLMDHINQLVQMLLKLSM